MTQRFATSSEYYKWSWCVLDSDVIRRMHSNGNYCRDVIIFITNILARALHQFDSVRVGSNL